MTRSTAYDEHPQHKIEIDPDPAGLRVTIDGEVVAETRRGLNLREGRYPAVVYVPREDIRMERFARSDHTTHCPFKGDASYFDFIAEAAEADGAREKAAGEALSARLPAHKGIAWSYETPFDQMDAIRDHLAFYADRVSLEPI